MASITIRNLDDDVKTCLRMRAAERHRSMEEEARLILRAAVGSSQSCERHTRSDSSSRRCGARTVTARTPFVRLVVAISVLLDTNVVSELLRPAPVSAVVAWVGDRWATGLYFSTIGEAELLYGVAILPAGWRQAALASAIEAILRENFDERILPFDSAAARAYANIAAQRRSTGRPVAPADCQIAAIACLRGMALATRNVRDFEDIDIKVVDPWATP